MDDGDKTPVSESFFNGEGQTVSICPFAWDSHPVDFRWYLTVVIHVFSAVSAPWPSWCPKKKQHTQKITIDT
jgi:hypothetical protein